MKCKGPLSGWHRLALCLFGLTVLSACSREPEWNVLLFTLDTTRADHIGCYGNTTIETPNLDGLAARGIRFTNAFSAIPLTTPSHATILTGKYPFGHGVRDNGSFILPKSQLTLAEILAGRGYGTGAAVGSFPLVRRFGVDQGFDFYDDHVTRYREDLRGEEMRRAQNLFFDERPAGEVNDAILPWLEANADRPFFAWIHYYDPHQPTMPPSPYDQLYADDPYDGEIAYADEAIGVVLRHLERLGVSERTLVIFTSDHGEGLDQHQESTHSQLLYNSTQNVPLIIRVPGGRQNAVVEEWVSLVDILPTVLDLLDIRPPSGLHGKSLAGHLQTGSLGEEPRPIPLYAETLSPRLSHGWGELRAIMDPPHKLIYGPRPELYNLDKDRDELWDLMAEEPELFHELETKLSALLSEFGQPPEDAFSEIDEQALEMLRSLGYVGDAAMELSSVEKLSREGIPPQDRAADVSRWSSARRMLAEGNGLGARMAMRPLVDADPTNRTYLEMLALAEIELGNADRAYEIFETMVAHHPVERLSTRVPLGIAGVRARHGDLKGALDMLTVVQKIGQTADSWYRQAMIEELLERWAAYYDALKNTLDLEPGHAPARVALGVYHAKRGELEVAEQELRRAIKDQPYYATGWYNLGVLMLGRERPRESLDCFLRSIRLRPDYLKAHFALVDTLASLGEVEKARAAYEDLAALAPESEESITARNLLENLP